MQTLENQNHPLTGSDPESVPAFARLRMLDGPEEITLTGGVEDAEEIRQAIH